LSNLDAALRVQMRGGLIEFHREMRATIVYVTHDQIEAMTMGDRIAVIRDGRFQQIGPPRDVYRHPANVFVATFLGSPKMNIVRVEVDGEGGLVRIKHGELEWRLPAERLPPVVPANLLVGFRPEAIRLSGQGADPSPASLSRPINHVENVGNELIVHLS